MKQFLINTYSFNLLYATQLVSDVQENIMALAPAKGLENHPAFTLGHLCSAAALTSKYLGGPYDYKPEWEDLFKRKGPGDPKIPDIGINIYPHKKELLDELTKQHILVEELITNLEEHNFKEPVEWRFNDFLPTVGDMLHFMCISHEAMHLGQLAAWRRAMGLMSALAKL